jgi:hypothetical protein
MSNKWMDMISNSEEQSAEFNISPWLSRATLDAIGEGKIYARYSDIVPHLLQLLLMSASAPLITMRTLLHMHTVV